MAVFKTPKGTELSILNLRGKDYLEVKYRIVWFREEKPEWSIETEFVQLAQNQACAKATIRDESGRIIATSHKIETASGFPDFAEKAETGAIGRALALIGYGTQFTGDELEEGGRVVDSPVGRPPSPLQAHQSIPKQVFSPAVSEALNEITNPGDFLIMIGKKYAGKRVKDVPQEDLENYINWLVNSAHQKGKDPTPEVMNLKNAFNKYYPSGQEMFNQGDSGL